MAAKSDSDTTRARPTLVRAIHPVRDAIFNAFAPSTTTIRTARNLSKKTCSQCFKIDQTPGVTMQKCSRCQTKDWTVHKSLCHDVERALSKLIAAFLVNPLLRGYLEVALCLDFDFVNNPAPDIPHMARIDVGLEPSDITVTLGLYAGSRWSDNPEPDKIEGMLQINAITVVPRNVIPHANRLDTMQQELRAEGKGDTLAVIVEFISNDSPGAFSAVLNISPIAMKIAKDKEPFEDHSVLTGRSLSPKTVASTLEQEQPAASTNGDEGRR